MQAFIASEDAGFFDHGGVSFTGLLRGLYQTYVKRTRIVGGSTLSQQTAKAIIASSEGAKAVRVRSGWAGVRRKVREFILTRRLESNFNKEQILNLYLNEVYLGHHAYGVQAAAENYFRKNVWELTLPEMALIAGLPQAPSAYSPFAHPDKAKARRGYVLRRMFEEGMIGAKQRDAADASAIEVYPVQDIFRETAPLRPTLEDVQLVAADRADEVDDVDQQLAGGPRLEDDLRTLQASHGRQVGSQSLRGSMGSMCGTERIIDKDIPQPGQVRGKARRVGFFLGVKTHVLQEKHLAHVQRRRGEADGAGGDVYD